MDEHVRMYSRLEIDLALRILSEHPMDLHPNLVSKEGYLYWNIVRYYGSVFTAVQKVCGPEVTNAVFGSPTKPSCMPPPAPEDVYPSGREDRNVFKCGALSCLVLETAKRFQRCSRCRIRRYCSPTCQTQDWSTHKLLCYPRSGASKEEKCLPGKDEDREVEDGEVKDRNAKDEEMEDEEVENGELEEGEVEEDIEELNDKVMTHATSSPFTYELLMIGLYRMLIWPDVRPPDIRSIILPDTRFRPGWIPDIRLQINFILM